MDTLIDTLEPKTPENLSQAWANAFMYNSAQVKEMFDNEAILIGISDGVPVYRAAEIFGTAAAKFAERLKSGYTSNGFGIGDFTLNYLCFSDAPPTVVRVEDMKGNIVVPPEKAITLHLKCWRGL